MDHVKKLEKEIYDLRRILTDKENELIALKKSMALNYAAYQSESNSLDETQYGDKLPKWAIVRYSRQILLSNIGVKGQERICAARVLVVGAGGLGCPAATYLAGAGVGVIGLVDYDNVDITNIHRQTLHSEGDQEASKVESAAQKLRRLNSYINIVPHNVQLTSKNAKDIATGYDVILDCTDNVPTRYLLNDLSVMLKVPLISGSALKMEGQLTIYGYRGSGEERQGPCYRCIFPSPSPPDTVGSCSTNGVVGPAPAVIGTLQALEALKIIVGFPQDKLLVKRMLLFDGEDMTFRVVNLRGNNSQCAVCSDAPTITRLIDYEVFCNAKAKEKDLDLKILPTDNRISANELRDLLRESSDDQRHLLVDVRSEQEFDMCRLHAAVNCPIDSLTDVKFENLLKSIRSCNSQVIFICRRGNDSQIVAKKVIDAIEETHRGKVKDLSGGLHAWARDVDDNFPVY